MAIQIVDDSESVSVTEDFSGYRATRTAKVSGIQELAPGVSTPRKIRHVLDLPGVLPLNTPYPTADPNDPQESVIVRRTARIANPNLALVDYEYGQPDVLLAEPSDDGYAEHQVTTTTRTIQTQLDANGRLIEVARYLRDQNGTVLPGPPEYQWGFVEREVPLTIIRFHRLELSSPLDRAIANVGKVNGEVAFGQGIGTWLVSGMGGDSVRGGQAWQNWYQFTHNAAVVNIQGVEYFLGWRTLLVWDDDDDERDRRFRPTYTIGDGLAIADNYLPILFQNLNLLV